jgi:predicted ferric reductase
MKKYLLYAAYILNLVVILYFWSNNSGALLSQGGGNALLAIGRLVGLIAVVGVLTQFILIGREVWIEQLFGLDKLARVHHILGQITYIFIILHPILIIQSYSMLTGKSFIQQDIAILTNFEDTLQAAAGVFLFTIVVATSIYIVRKKLKYETWYYVHLINYLAVLLIWGHQLKVGEDFLVQPNFTLYWYLLYAFVFGNFIFSRFIRPAKSFFKHRFYVQKLLSEPADTTSIYITGKNIEDFKYQAGQFVIVIFLAKGYYWQKHPFSISKAYDGKNIRLSIKASGDFTKTVSNIPVNTPVWIDGPLGIFTSKIIKSDKILFIAGGIGITPIRAMLEELGPKAKDMILIYGNKTKQDIVFFEELSQLSQKYNFPIYHILSNITVAEPGFEQGFVDKDKIVSHVKDLTEREIFICGPPIMLTKLVPTLKDLGVQSKNIHYEKFSL